MSSLLGILVCCVLLVTASTIQAQNTQINDASLRNQPALRHVRAAKRPPGAISIPEDEANGLTKLVNGFPNVFAAKTDPAAADSPRDEGSNILTELINGFINVFAAKTDPAAEDSPLAVKQLTINFEEALQEIETQKETIAELKKEMRETRATVSLQNEEIVMRGEELAEFKGKMRQVVTKQAEKDSEQDQLLEKLNGKVFPSKFYSTVAPLPNETSTAAPFRALQVYRRSGFAGLTGKPLNIENEEYKGEFLYLARNPTDRSADVLHDGATLAVGGDKLRQSAFQWEFVRVPGGNSSVVYLRNKLNELKTIPSKQDLYGRWNYIRIETVSSGTGGEASQLVITMKETVDNYYYYPYSTPNTDSALNGREILRDSSTSKPGLKWIVTLAS